MICTYVYIYNIIYIVYVYEYMYFKINIYLYEQQYQQQQQQYQQQQYQPPQRSKQSVEEWYYNTTPKLNHINNHNINKPMTSQHNPSPYAAHPIDVSYIL